MGDITIEKDTFHDRLSGFISHWKSDKRAADGLFNGANSIIIPIGKANDATDNYSKTAAFQLWLLGYEFPATIIALTTDGITFVTTKKKAIYLEPLKGGKVAVDVLVRGKDADANKAHFAKCVDVAKAAGSKVGVIAGEPQTGPFVDEWKPVCDELLATVEEVDITEALSFTALAVKDEKELRLIRDASRASSYVLGTKVVGEITKIIDDGRKIAHDKLAEKIAGVIDDDKFFAKAKISSDFDSSALDWAISPVVQSGGNYDLKFSSPSDDKNLHSGVIIAGLGLRYNTYASFLARTYMVDPDKSQESNYKLLLAVHNAVVKNIRDGVAAKDVYNKALAQVKAKDEELASHFVKSVGYAIGIENRDKTLTLSPKCSRTLKDGMTFVVLTGFTDLEKSGGDKLGRTYSMALADTVRVGLGVASNETAVYTNKNAGTDLQTVAFFFEQDEPTPKKPAKKDNRIAVAQQSLPSTRLRKERQANHDAEKEAQRRENQHMLHERKQKQGLEKYSKKGSGSNGTTEKQIKRFESYKRDDQLPAGIQDMGIVLDKKGNTIVLPILGRPVPFHISTIKNASTTAEGEYTSLRINFLSPGQGVGRKDDLPFEDPTAQFIRSLTFRSAKADRMSNFAAGITDMKKQAIRMEQEKKQLEDVVEQDKIRIDRRPNVLDHIFLRPPLDSKRIPGTVQIHENGIRYIHGGDRTQVDLLFNNIKHLFFQPCKHELVVIIHLHLINPIMIGKKKTKDVQFLREATDMQFDETGNRKRKHRYGDEEEFEQEQEERRRRSELDKLFLSFAKKIEDAGRSDNLKLDIPIRDLGFFGVPSRSNVYVQPTADCIVQLTESPFLVVTLDDIEIVHLERVTFGLKNFDMIIVFKDYKRPVQHVNTIPMESIDAVKDWLNGVEMPFYEGNLNLQWGSIMKTVQDDPYTFFKDGGWSFLANDSEDEDGDEESSEESAFEMDESDFGSEASSEEESDFDENASQEAEDDAMSDEEEGEDWDELEKKAARKDREAAAEDGKARGAASKPSRKRKR